MSRVHLVICTSLIASLVVTVPIKSVAAEALPNDSAPNKESTPLRSESSLRGKSQKKRRKSLVSGIVRSTINFDAPVGNDLTERALASDRSLVEVGLSGAQTEKLMQLNNEFLARTAPIEEKLHILEAKFQQSLNNKNLDLSEVGYLGSLITTQQQILNCLVIEHRVDRAKILTGTQSVESIADSHFLQMITGIGGSALSDVDSAEKI